MGKTADPGDLPQIVRTLRDRLRDTQAEFAEFLGVAQTTVSQYEKGRSIPSTEVLVKMMFLSSWADLREAIIQHIQQRFGTQNDDDWEERFKAFYRMRNRSSAPVVPLFDVSADVARIFQLYRKHRARPESDDVFRKAADYIEVQLGDAGLRAGKQPQAKGSRRTRKAEIA